MSDQYVYVASSWRNSLQVAVCAALKAAGIPHYDFKNPEPGKEEFHWDEVGMPSYRRSENNAVPVDEYLKGIDHPIAVAGFERDMGALKRATEVVLVQPCGKSAHLELGWASAQPNVRTAVILEDPVVPDLMYRMADYLTNSLFELLGWLGVED